MKILVTFAVEPEFAPWRKLRQFSQAVAAEVKTYATQMGSTELTVLLTGVGGRKAWAEATKIIWDGNVDVCISSGLAGALRPEHRPGEILAAKEVHATSWNKVIPSDSALLKLASGGGAKIVDTFYSADRVLVRAEDKQQLGTKADAVEMESGEILLEAVAFGAKVIAIRSVSDAAEEDLPLDFNRVNTDSGDISIGRILMETVRHPSSVPALIKFGLQSRRAAANLAEFLDSYVQKLAQAPLPKKAEEVSTR
jgi:adenosylhomocysteine nucleosidase